MSATLLVPTAPASTTIPAPITLNRPARLKAVLEGLSDSEFKDVERIEAPRAEDRHLTLVPSGSPMSRRCWARSRRPGAMRSTATRSSRPARARRRCARRAPWSRRSTRWSAARRRTRSARCGRRATMPRRRRRWASACSTTSWSARCTRASTTASTRVAVIDFDVHHGNGTQHMFERDAAPALRLDASMAALSRHRCRRGARRGQHRQRAAARRIRAGRSSAPASSATSCRHSTNSARAGDDLGRVRRASRTIRSPRCSCTRTTMNGSRRRCSRSRRRMPRAGSFRRSKAATICAPSPRRRRRMCGR